jgi:hypothetical protein
MQELLPIISVQETQGTSADMYSTCHKIASPMLDIGVFQFAALKGEMDMGT